MDAQHASESQPGTARDGECFECRERLPGRLLWPLQRTVQGPPENAVLCFACVAVDMLRIAAGGLDDAPQPPGTT